MDFEYITGGLKRVLALVEDCRHDGVSAMERDLMLKELRDIYTAVRFGGDMPAAESVPSACAAAAEPAAVVVHETFAEMPAETAEPAGVAEPAQSELADVPVEEPAQPETAEEETAAEPTEPTAESEQQADPFDNVEAMIGGADDDAAAQRRRMIVRSLYGEEFAESEPQPAVEPAPEPEPQAEPTEQPAEPEPSAVAPTPAVEEPAKQDEVHAVEPAPTVGESFMHHDAAASEPVLGETINAGVQTLADTLPVSENAADAMCRGAIDDLRAAIGLNDRFQLIRDLFYDDVDAFEHAVAKLNSFDNLDDCMVYIVGNYDWNPWCEGAKLMMSLLERRYSNRR